MELYFLDENFDVTAGPMDEFTSIVWEERYFETGTFTLHFPRALLAAIGEATYVRTGDDGPIRCGRIEYVETADDGGCEMGGHLLEVLLSDRVIEGKKTYSGEVTQAVCRAVRENLRGLSLAVEEGDSLGETVTFSGEWDNLAAKLYAVLKPYGASFTITLDRETNRPVFRVVRGKNRSTTGGEHQPAIFSSSFGNIVSISMNSVTDKMKNRAYIEGSDGTVVCVDNAGGKTGREIYKKASDLSPTDFSTNSAYLDALQQRGRELLAKYPTSVFVCAECDTEALPLYGRDYTIGDICDVVDEELCLSFALRLTAVDFVYENGTHGIYPSFGEEISTVRRIAAE